ncbi:MAG: methyltransferase domain-containing protein [Candidatus Micrarchaeia archaeon]
MRKARKKSKSKKPANERLSRTKITEKLRLARNNSFDRAGMYKNNRTLREVNRMHGRNFEKIIKEMITQFKASEKKPLNVLDEGCGESTFIIELKKKFKDKINAVALDVKPIPKMREHCNANNISYKIWRVGALSKKFPKEHFHLIVSTAGGLFHSPTPAQALREALKVTKKRGRVIAHIPAPRFETHEIKFPWKGPAFEKIIENHKFKPLTRGKATVPSCEIVKKSSKIN